MKKVITFLLAFYFAIIPIRAYASGASVEIDVKGQVNKGESIDILVNVKDVEKFYAASVDFIYDTNFLKVDNIQATDFITKHSNDIMELGGEVDKNGNTATYSFTFLGDKDGISGSGNLVTIKATVISDGKLSVTEDNMKVKLVQRSGDTVENYSFKFIGYGVESNNTGITPKPEDNNGQSNSNQSNNNEQSNSNKPNNSEDKEIVTNTTVEDNNNSSTNSNENIEEQSNTEKDNSITNETNKDEKDENLDKNQEDNSDKVSSQQLQNKNSTGTIVIAIVLLGLIGFGGYKIYNNKK